MMACHQPLTLLHIAFAPGQIFCVACIDQENFQSRLFQDVEHSDPTYSPGVKRRPTECRYIGATQTSWWGGSLLAFARALAISRF